MLRYALRRILFFVPTLVVITLLGFVISVHSPVDPVNNKCSADLTRDGNLARWRQCQLRERAKFGLDLPVFYLELASLAEPDTLYRFFDPATREGLQRLLHASGNWPAVQDWHRQIQVLYQAHLSVSLDTPAVRQDQAFEARHDYQFSQERTLALLRTGDQRQIQFYLNALDSLYTRQPALTRLKHPFDQARAAWQQLQTAPVRWKNWVP